MLSGANGTLLSVARDRGSMRVRGNKSERTCERAGVGKMGTCVSDGTVDVGIGGEGKCERVRVGGSSGGFRD